MTHEFETILKDVQTQFNVTREEMMLPSRGTAAVAGIRMIAMYRCWDRCHNFSAVGSFFGRDRTTVRHAVQTVMDKK